jgi:hypothetical protein
MSSVISLYLVDLDKQYRVVLSVFFGAPGTGGVKRVRFRNIHVERGGTASFSENILFHMFDPLAHIAVGALKDLGQKAAGHVDDLCTWHNILFL